MGLRAQSIGIAAAWLVLATFPGVARAATIGTLEQIAPIPTVYLQGTDFLTFNADEFNAEGDVTALLAVVPNFGEAGDFAGFTPGRIALIARGGLPTFTEKVNNAAAAGAIAALIFNNAPGFPAVGVSFNAPTTIPALFISQSLGQNLAALSQPTIHVAVAVPEPATAALLTLGIAVIVRRRRVLIKE